MLWLTILENSKEMEESKDYVSSDQHGKNGFIKIAPTQIFSLLPAPSSLSSSGTTTVLYQYNMEFDSCQNLMLNT